MLTSEDIADLSIKGEEIIGDIYDDNLSSVQVEKIDFDDSFETSKSKRRIIGGLATTSIIDRENEEISSKAIEKIWQRLEKLPEKYLNLMIGHESTQIGYLIKSYKNRKMALLDKGIYIIAELRQDIPLADKIWKSILKRELHSFSVKIGIPEPLRKNIEEVCNENKCWTRINDAVFLEVSLVETPANQECENVDILSENEEKA